MQEQNPKKSNSYNYILFIFISIIIFFMVMVLINYEKKSIKNNSKENTEIAQITDSTSKKIVDDINSKYSQNTTKNIDSTEYKKIRSTFRRVKEEFTEELYFYLPSNYPQYRNTNYVGFYFSGDKNKSKDLHFIIQYAADDWLFIESVKFDFDGKFYEYGPLNCETHVSNGIQEWSDNSVDLGNELVQNFKKAKSVKYRLIGKQFYRDYKMSPEKLKKIQNTIKLYDYMR